MAPFLLFLLAEIDIGKVLGDFRRLSHEPGLCSNVTDLLQIKLKLIFHSSLTVINLQIISSGQLIFPQCQESNEAKLFTATLSTERIRMGEPHGINYRVNQCD